MNENKKKLKNTRNFWFDKENRYRKTEKNREKKTKFKAKKQKRMFVKIDKKYAFSVIEKAKKQILFQDKIN